MNHLFERNKDSHFLSEIIYAAPYMDKYDEVKVLKRFFTFIELSYHYKRDLTNIDFIKSLAGYENWVSSKQKLCNLLFSYMERIDRKTILKINKRLLSTYVRIMTI